MKSDSPNDSHTNELHWRRARALTRRHFLQRSQFGLGGIALLSLLNRTAVGLADEALESPLAVRPPAIAPRAKNVIYLHMSGAPPQQDLFDWKPKLVEHNLEPCPQEFLEGARFAFIKGHPKLLGTPHSFQQFGQAGIWVSSLLPEIASVADELTIVKSMWTDQFNHSPAELFLFTGSPRPGGASLGSWATWGLGSENQDLPGYVVMISGGTDPSGGKSLWSAGFLPSVYQGVQCRNEGEPILYVTNPDGVSRDDRRRTLDALKELNDYEYRQFGDPETLTRISQYELAFRMQMSVPSVLDITRETRETLELYGAKPGEASFANNCLQARRLVESGVRFVQLFDWGWDIHGTDASNDLVAGLPKKCAEMDRPVAALIKDLKRRGLLDSTLVVWGGEFGRTSLNEERNGSKLLGRDHHPHCFTIFMAGGGVKAGMSFGETDELGYFVARDKVTVPDLQATLLHLLGLDPYKLSYRYQGLQQRLIGPTDDGQVRRELLA